MKHIADIKNASILFDQDKNLFYCDPDNSEGFWFDEQDLGCFAESNREEVKEIVESYMGKNN